MDNNKRGKEKQKRSTGSGKKLRRRAKKRHQHHVNSFGLVQWSGLNWMAGLGGPVIVYILNFNFNYYKQFEHYIIHYYYKQRGNLVVYMSSNAVWPKNTEKVLKCMPSVA